MPSKDPVGRDQDGDFEVIKKPDYLTLWHLNVGPIDLVTLDNFVITPTQSNLGILVGNTSTLRTINDGTDGSILILRAQPGVVVQRNIGNIKLRTNNMTFATQWDTLMLLKTDSNWIELSRSNN